MQVSNRINNINEFEQILPDEKTYLPRNRCKPIDIEWEKLTVKTTIVKNTISEGRKVRIKKEKTILNEVSGSLIHGTFTAIMGPSGCGKTTLLNVLSNRSDARLRLMGKLRVNSHQVDNISIISNLLAFVQQDDVLLPSITPREIFHFTACLRLALPPIGRKNVVDALLMELGLSKCADTKIGNNLIRGLSGGEKKRTSIGVELITNPSMVFLDEPTTGLDSTTSLKIIELLLKLAKSGRTIVSTIHQPSSEIFEQIDNLMLMVRGNIIYSGLAKNAVGYFKSIGFECPKLTNPADYFMKLMSEAGMIIEQMQSTKRVKMVSAIPPEIEKKFQERIELMVSHYKSQRDLNKENIVYLTEELHEERYRSSWLIQLKELLKRSLVDQFRNPLDVLMKIVQNIIFILIVTCLWTNLSNDITGIQDRNGALSMLSTMSSFVALTGSMGVFSIERPVYIREVQSQTYSPSAYFIAKMIAEFPFFFIYPVILVSGTYWALGLNTYDFSKVMISVGIHVLVYFSGTGLGLSLSTFFPKIEVAFEMLILLAIPLYACSGLFVDHSNIPKYFYVFEYISPFKYGFQALAINEYTDLHTLTCSGNPACDYLAFANFDEDIGVCALGLAATGIVFRLLAYLGLRIFGAPKASRFQSI